jgi:enoyl-CoA hydratase
MGEEPVLLSVVSGVALVTLNRPGSRNALNTQLMEALQSHLARLDTSSEVRACVLTGAGTAFCAGADLKERSDLGEEQLRGHTVAVKRCADMVADLAVPVIAAVNGPAYAGGLEIAVACDIRIASERATFALPEVRLGIFPGAGGPVRLPRLVGQGWARLMIFTGEPIDAAKAVQIGMVEKVVPHDSLMDEALAVARRIASNSLEGVQAAKRLLNAAVDLPYSEASALSDDLRHPLNRGARWQAAP